MASDVEICNRALQKLGVKRITALTDDSVNARACNAAFVAVRQSLLRKHKWQFSIQRASLAADATAPSWGRANAYQLPSGFLKLLPPYPEDNLADRDWIIEGRKILSDESAPLYIRYVADVTDPNEMDALFREYFSTVLAMELCQELTNSTNRKKDLKEDVIDILKDAKKANAIENVPSTAVTDEWITSRE